MASPETVVWRYSIKKLLLRLMKNAQETPVFEPFLIKLQSEDACSFIKKRIKYSCLPVHLKNTYFEKHLWTTAFVSQIHTFFINNAFFHPSLSGAKLFHKLSFKCFLGGLTTYKHYHTETLFIVTIFVSMSRPRYIYVVSM